jgi:hypothetical protein
VVRLLQDCSQINMNQGGEITHSAMSTAIKKTRSTVEHLFDPLVRSGAENNLDLMVRSPLKPGVGTYYALVSDEFTRGPVPLLRRRKALRTAFTWASLW